MSTKLNQIAAADLFQAIPHAMLLLDSAGQITMLNELAIKMFRYPRDELLKKSYSELLPQLFLDNHLDRNQFQAQGSDVYALQKNGTEIPVKLNLNSLTINAEIFYLISIIDISEQKNLEKDLNDFTYSASHDLKEPLRGIYNYSLFLIEDYQDKIDQEGQNKLQTLIKLSNQLDGLINSLHRFSQMGRSEIMISRHDLQQIINELLESWRTHLQEKNIQINFPRPLPQINCDFSYVTDIFRNLISNAIIYNDKPNPSIEIGYDDTDAENLNQIVFYVRDNGIGIAEQYFETIFKLFKRLHARDKFGGGYGAGLTITKKLVERHRGKIWLESKLSKGSCFYFSLPNL